MAEQSKEALKTPAPKIPALKRGIRFRDLVLLYVVIVLSVRWTAAAANAGPSILIVWVAALIGFFIPLAACVMELSSRYPQEGGIYIWTREALGDFSGFICAWAYWMSNLPFFAAVLYFGAASTLFAFGPRAQALNGNPIYFIVFSVFWLAVITLLNIRGVDAGKWLNNVGALGSLLPLSLLLMMGAVSYWRFGPAIHITTASLIPHWSFDNAVFWSSVFFAFSAIESASAMGDEIQNPRRSIPWALLIGGVILAVGYIGGTFAFLITVPASTVGGPDGFVNGMHLLAGRLGMEWLLAPMALLVALNAVGGAIALCGRRRSLSSPCLRRHSSALSNAVGGDCCVRCGGNHCRAARPGGNDSARSLQRAGQHVCHFAFLALFISICGDDSHAKPPRFVGNPPRAGRQAGRDLPRFNGPVQHRCHDHSFYDSRRGGIQQAVGGHQSDWRDGSVDGAGRDGVRCGAHQGTRWGSQRREE
jgi:hypothetical protein